MWKYAQDVRCFKQKLRHKLTMYHEPSQHIGTLLNRVTPIVALSTQQPSPAVHIGDFPPGSVDPGEVISNRMQEFCADVIQDVEGKLDTTHGLKDW